jgi:hypothetical protein
MSGQIVDASLVAAPKQRNTEEEKQAIKEGKVRRHKRLDRDNRSRCGLPPQGGSRCAST